jgi:DNA repair protein RadC
MRLLNHEVVKVLLLNAKFRLLAVEEVSRGSLDSVTIHAREIFQLAILRKAYAILVVHNHPSGFPQPSLADHQVTTQLKKAAELLQIRLFDHVILLSKRLDKRIYAKCWIMPSWGLPSVRIRAKTGRPPDWNLG